MLFSSFRPTLNYVKQAGTQTHMLNLRGHSPFFANQVYRAGRVYQAAVEWGSGAGYPGVFIAEVPRRRQRWQVTIYAIQVFVNAIFQKRHCRKKAEDV